jgi:hypothetical protein
MQRHASAAGKRLDAHHGQVAVIAAELEPEVDGWMHRESLPSGKKTGTEHHCRIPAMQR